MSKEIRLLLNFKLWAMVLLLIFNRLTFAKSKVDMTKASSLAKTSEYMYQQFDGNTIVCWMQNNGFIVSYLITGNAGMEWPQRSNQTIDFASGLWLAGKTPEGELRTAATEYNTEFQPGPILPDGTAADPNDPAYRIYKINSDGSGDWDTWPFDQGAPALKAADGSDSLDIYGNKIPLLIGDQTLFWVMNDLDINAHANLFATNPMGVEVQVLVFGYNANSPLGNVMFIQWKIINKSNIDYNSCYVALWDDPDVGDFIDDLVGCDTTLELGYCYNGNPRDASYSTLPPALGFDFFQGPEQPKGSGNYLPLTSFAYYWAGSPEPFGDPQSATQMYNFMQGLASDGSPYIDPSGNPSKFVFTGDPVTGTGWLDPSPNDKRFLMSSGPFTLAVGDTQVIIGAKICAQRTTNLLSVAELKESDQIVQSFYDGSFANHIINSVDVQAIYESTTQTRVWISTKVYNPATVIVATLMDADGNIIDDMEMFDDGFHNDGVAGDRLWANETTIVPYQVPIYVNLSIQTTSETYEFKKIAKASTAGPMVISELNVVSDHINSDGIINPDENIRVTGSLQNGSNFNFSTIITMFDFIGPVDFRDEFSQTFSNVAATQIIAGNYNPADPSTFDIFQVAEDAQDGDTIWTNITLFDDLGNRWYQQLTLRVEDFEFEPGDLTAIDHVAGIGSGDFYYRVVNPDSLTSHTYEIQIIEPADTTDVYGFGLVDVNDSKIVLADHPLPDKYSHNIPVTEGFKLFGSGFGTKTPITYAAAAQTVDADPGDPGLYLRGDATFWGENTGLYNELGNGMPTPPVNILQRDLELRFTGITDTGDWFGVVTSGGSMATQWERYIVGEPDLSGFAHVSIQLPFELWDIENNRQINCAVINRNRDGECPYANGVGDPSTPGMEPRWRITGGDYIIPIFTDYDPNAIQSPNDPLATWILFFSWFGSSTWTTGDVFKISYRNLLTASDKYRFQPIYTGLDDHIALIKEFRLFQNFPNPFNPLTIIKYHVPYTSQINLKIFNALGQQVKTLFAEIKGPGKYAALWDGKNEAGINVASGLYFYRLETTNFVEIKKMILLR